MYMFRYCIDLNLGKMDIFRFVYNLQIFERIFGDVVDDK